MPGKGKLIVTGQLGDVMKESAQAALSCVRGHARVGRRRLVRRRTTSTSTCPRARCRRTARAPASRWRRRSRRCVTGRPVRDDVAMTGEITLTGQVLPIGGLKEKALAAQRAGITRVIAPRRNEPDLEDIPEHLRARPRVRLGVERSRRCSPRRSTRAGGFARGRRRGMLAGQDATRPMRGGMGAKKKAAKAGAAAAAVKKSPYVRRIAEDEELRDEPLERLRVRSHAVGRLQNGKHPTKQIFDDKKLQKDIKSAAESFRDASVALREAPKRKRKRGGLGKLLLLGIVGARPRARGVRGPAQEGARRAVRRRGGVRVHLDHRARADADAAVRRAETAASTN